ncbi:histidine phosphatase family protein [Dactylosporangium sp. NPDC051485]|uniref:histidine phosphatase family protein n=1 Tax=Dactylosporangium sp. NPDC051485 TaxID=3154846 RepID=UPI00343C2C39
MGEIVVVRHGQTEWSAAGRHTSTTDLDLTPEGEAGAEALSRSLANRSFVAVLCSPRRRVLRTAELAGLTVTEVDQDTVEWDYGDYEGRTTADIRAEAPRWDLWRDGCPGGETPDRVTARLDRLLAKLRPMLALGDVVVVTHGHAARALAARWLEQPVAFGAHLTLGTATLSVLGHEHDVPSLRLWNAPPA